MKHIQYISLKLNLKNREFEEKKMLKILYLQIIILKNWEKLYRIFFCDKKDQF